MDPQEKPVLTAYNTFIKERLPFEFAQWKHEAGQCDVAAAWEGLKNEFYVFIMIKKDGYPTDDRLRTVSGKWELSV